jgi:hypothetical protein
MENQKIFVEFPEVTHCIAVTRAMAGLPAKKMLKWLNFLAGLAPEFGSYFIESKR